MQGNETEHLALDWKWLPGCHKHCHCVNKYHWELCFLLSVVELQLCPVKFNTTYLAYTLKDVFYTDIEFEGQTIDFKMVDYIRIV